MAEYKKPKQKENPGEKHIRKSENPESYYSKNPAWNFHKCDIKKWVLSKDTANDYFWDSILPKLKSLETQTWSEILVEGKKGNHSIEPNSLNSEAKKRLNELYIEQEAIISLRIDGTHRLYGFMNNFVFNIIWFDSEHGDNEKCVCRSHKKHT